MSKLLTDSFVKLEITFANFITVESTSSTQTSDSYEYYQTEIFDLLPSIQASRPDQGRPGLLEPCEANQGGTEPEQSSSGHLPRGQRDKPSMEPLRNLAICIQAKRDARWEAQNKCCHHVIHIRNFGTTVTEKQETRKEPSCFFRTKILLSIKNVHISMNIIIVSTIIRILKHLPAAMFCF